MVREVGWQKSPGDACAGDKEKGLVSCLFVYEGRGHKGKGEVKDLRNAGGERSTARNRTEGPAGWGRDERWMHGVHDGTAPA